MLFNFLLKHNLAIIVMNSDYHIGKYNYYNLSSLLGMCDLYQRNTVLYLT